MILECHSKGDKRFSALYARLKAGKTIEQYYQYAKRDGEGKPYSRPKGMTPAQLLIAGQLYLCTPELRHDLYRMFWYVYLMETQQDGLYLIAVGHEQFRDIFAERGRVIDIRDTDLWKTDGGCSQARAIAQLVAGYRQRGLGMFAEPQTESVKAALAKYMANYPWY